MFKHPSSTFFPLLQHPASIRSTSMAALQLRLVPLAHLKRPEEDCHAHQQQHHQNKRQKVMTRDLDDDNSWEVRAFAEDTNSTMGITWPPRFYACSFCGREFRSAQALGGHMNVHRRDRAQAQLLPRPVPPQVLFTEVAAGGGGGICFVNGQEQIGISAKDSSSANFDNSFGSICFGRTASDLSLMEKVGSLGTSSDELRGKDDVNGEDLVVEELDLELRLGC